MNDSRGLEPSEYAGGGSLSSSFFDDSPFVSAGRAALVSALTSRSCELEGSRASGAYAGTELVAPASVTAVLYASTTSAVEWYNEENGGGRGDGGEDPDASEIGYWGGGDCARLTSSSSFDS